MRETDVEVIRSRCAFAMASPNSPESVAGPRGSFCALGQGDGVSRHSGHQLSPTRGRERLILDSSCLVFHWDVLSVSHPSSSCCTVNPCFPDSWGMDSSPGGSGILCGSVTLFPG